MTPRRDRGRPTRRAGEDRRGHLRRRGPPDRGGCSDGETGNKGDWKPRKDAYLGKVATDDGAVLLVSASDKLHNARTIVADARATDGEVWGRFNAGRDAVLWYYEGLVAAFGANPASNRNLVAELRATVEAMRAAPAGPRAESTRALR